MKNYACLDCWQYQSGVRISPTEIIRATVRREVISDTFDAAL